MSEETVELGKRNLVLLRFIRLNDMGYELLSSIPGTSRADREAKAGPVRDFLQAKGYVQGKDYDFTYREQGDVPVLHLKDYKVLQRIEEDLGKSAARQM